MALPAMLASVRASVESTAARLVTSMILLFLTLVVALIAAGFFVTAFYLWLTTMLPAHLAALATGGLMLMVSFVALLALRLRNRRAPPAVAQPPPATRRVDSDPVELLQRCLQGAGGRPDGLLAALALGIIAGLFSSRSPGGRS